jgi:tRNA(Ile)-lysidine synthase
MHRTEKWVLDYITCHGLVTRGEKVVVAVSGGADSLSLLHILHNVQDELGIIVHVAHLDHSIRGDASIQDAAYVEALAEELGLPYTVEKRDVTGYWQVHKISLEEAAREVRYQFLGEVVKNTGAASVAVAHTLNDHGETVLLHLLRGSGLSGLVGLKRSSILQYKRVGPLRVIRPLLCLSRDEVEEYCRDLNLEYRTDATNESLTHTRNRIRLKLLPKLRKEFNPRIDDAISRLSRFAADDVDFVEEKSKKAAEKIAYSRDEVTVIDKAAFLELHPALRRGVLRQLLAAAAGSLKDIEGVHIEDMLDVAEGDTGRRLDLWGGLAFTVGYRDLLLGRNLAAAIPLPVLEGEHRLNIPGVTEIPGWSVSATVTNLAGGPPVKGDDPFVQVMDYDHSTGWLTVRARRAGDKFQPLGMSVEKAVKDFFIDAKVPRLWRPRVPVVVNPSQIVWVAGYRLDDRVKVTESTRQILRLEFSPKTPTGAV